MQSRRRQRWSYFWIAVGLGLATLPAGAAETSGQAGKLLFWEVKAPEKDPVYLLGAVHAARADFYPLPALIEQAFARAPVLAVEADVTDATTMAKAAPLLIYAPPDALDRHLRSATWAKVEAIARSAKLDVALFKPMRPALLADALLLQALARHGYAAQAGIDLHFLAEAHEAGKPVEELESVEFQFRVLAGLSDDDADQYLDDAIEEIRSGDPARLMDRMAQAWRAGDADALAKLLDEEGNRDDASRRLMRILFDERNPGMAERIAEYARSGRAAFVVVGAGHLVGGGSVITLLRDKGLSVRQLP